MNNWENRAVYKFSKKEVFYNAKITSFLKTLDFEDLKVSNAKSFFEWTKEKSIAFEKWFLSKNPDFKGDPKKLTDFFKGFVGEFFFYTLLTDVKTLVLKNSKGDRKLYIFRDVQLSSTPDFGVDLIAKVDCLNESKKSAIQVKFWNPESKEIIKNGYAAQIYGQAVCDKQIEPFENICIDKAVHFVVQYEHGGDCMNTDNLKAIRNKKGVTQKEAADALGISPNTYKNYEQGMREPNNDMLCKLADYFQVTTDYLLGRAPQADPMKLLVSQTDLSPEAQEENVQVLTELVGDELEILDPYGGTLQSYGLCFETMNKSIKKLVKLLNEGE